jgi:hypothetical protein
MERRSSVTDVLAEDKLGVPTPVRSLAPEKVNVKIRYIQFGVVTYLWSSN